MNTRLLGLGFSIVFVSIALLAYSFAYNNLELTGVSTSTFILGLTIIYTSFASTETVLNGFKEYLRFAENFLTSIIEEADLLDGKITVVKNPKDYYVVISKTDSAIQPYPGLTVRAGQPIIAVPVENVMENLSALETVMENLENNLSEILVHELGLCNRVKARVEGNMVRIVVEEVPGILKDELGRPVNVFNIMPSITLAKLVSASVKLIHQRVYHNSVELVYQVIKEK